MDAVLGCVRSFIYRLCCGSCIDDVDDVKDQEKFTTYKDAIKKACPLCTDDFEKTDFVARRIIGTPCCQGSYFHADCLANIAEFKKTTLISCPHCYVEFDEKQNRKNWESFTKRVEKIALTALAFRDEEVARELDAELKAKDKEEQARIQKQIADDERFAILLSHQ